MNGRKALAICLAVLAVGGALALLGHLPLGGTADAALMVGRSVGDVSRAEGSESITDPSAIGRFQIICGPLSRQDVYLLDTTKGKTWQMITDPTSGKLWWSPVPRR